MNDVAFVVPVYNEASVIADVIADIRTVTPHVVCVNDGSRDGSAQVIVKAGGYLVDHPINMGQGAALQTGIEFARALPQIQRFVTFDADGQHLVSDAVRMLELLESGELDIVLGSRFLGETVGASGAKKALLKAAVKFSNVTSGIRLTDAHNGLRAFNRHVAETMEITAPDMTHASEIIELIAANSYRYQEVPVTIHYTDYSTSKGQASVNAINIAVDTLLRRVTRK
ncbi:Glycosyltransferase involved in cell wall bisynthesis [Nocardioides exalbidus]|uniref:Glycosyltransferase involved in cell wall bisynthesis n=1 Tax=Nocardioides exalbidus TaxID=402596 RepID=A0A1H4JEG0_9ACTN|nr:glycosyltransferase family 2 protein [Nocardioides exalbidus]SEB44739.1 Glycosyltransferase involved in cell wall bisynthesis [Nocardioides exalbidus]